MPFRGPAYENGRKGRERQTIDKSYLAQGEDFRENGKRASFPPSWRPKVEPSKTQLLAHVTPKFRQNKRKTAPQPEIFLSFSVSMSVKMVVICHIYKKVGARGADQSHQMADRPRFLRHVCQYMYGESKNHWYKSIPESIHF